MKYLMQLCLLVASIVLYAAAPTSALEYGCYKYRTDYCGDYSIWFAGGQNCECNFFKFHNDPEDPICQAKVTPQMVSAYLPVPKDGTIGRWMAPVGYPTVCFIREECSESDLLQCSQMVIDPDTGNPVWIDFPACEITGDPVNEYVDLQTLYIGNSNRRCYWTGYVWKDPDNGEQIEESQE